ADDVDVAIRYGIGRYPGLHVERLMPEQIFPVCSPKLLKGRKRLDKPERLADFVLLHDDSPDENQIVPTWPMWFRAAGVKTVEAMRGPRFTQSSLVIEAAAAARGVALAKAALAEADLAEGRLVRPFAGGTKIDFAYWFVCPKSKLALPKVAAFRAWLLAEAKASGKE
ncbi:MAG: LysR family transcriptional regulator, partial [Alphaproteobacteria bacterium]|nr:LysR family transcriptional regulator [Alphaproteobacteria bacterium]